MSDPPELRFVSLPLMIGLVALPALFGWLLLRRGYARSLRQAVLAYAAIPPSLAIVATAIEVIVGR